MCGAYENGVVGLNVDDPVWDHSTFSFNRERLFDEEVAQQFFDNTVLVAQLKQLTSNEHFSVDGTLLDAWASHKSFRPKDGGGDDDDDFRGKPRSNDTHESTTDPDARLARKGKGKEAKLSYQANTLMENRNGLLMGVDVCHATGTSERDGALRLIDEMYLGKDCTLSADKGYDSHGFVAALLDRGIQPHIARNTAGRRSAITDEIAATAGYAISQQIRKRIEQPFGWSKTFGGLRKLMRIGLPDVRAWTLWVFATYNLIRIGGLEEWWEPAPT